MGCWQPEPWNETRRLSMDVSQSINNELATVDEYFSTSIFIYQSGSHTLSGNNTRPILKRSVYLS